MTDDATTAVSHCADCSAPLSPTQRYCHNCGQRTNVRRLTLRDVGHDFIRALVDVDRSFLSLLGALLIHPGVVARRYVAGARRRYFSPLAFLFITVGGTTLLIAALGFKMVTTDGAVNSFVSFLQSNPNVGLIAQAPLLAITCRLLFFRKGYNFAECLVLAAYTTGMRSAFIAVVALPVWYFARESTAAQALIYAYWALWYVYFGFAVSQFHNGNRWLLWLGGAATAAIAQFTAFQIIQWAAMAL